jgi:hypothetical protein
VLFFKRILRFTQNTTPPLDLRQAARHAVGLTFPFKAVLSLSPHDADGKLIVGQIKGQDWAGRLTNLSATGGSIQLSAASAATRGEACHLKLSLHRYSLELPCTAAHFRYYPQQARCGFSFNFPDAEVQKAYLQLLEPVAIGASLIAVPTKPIKNEATGLRSTIFYGHASTILTIWRQPSSDQIHGFDLRMNSCGVRWNERMPSFDIYGVTQPPTSPSKKSAPPPLIFSKLSDAQEEEVRWLFCLAIPNMGRGVPADVRSFFSKLIA